MINGSYDVDPEVYWFLEHDSIFPFVEIKSRDFGPVVCGDEGVVLEGLVAGFMADGEEGGGWLRAMKVDGSAGGLGVLDNAREA